MSKQMSLNSQDIKKWSLNLRTFLAPVFVIYILSVIATITASGGIFSLAYLIPTPIVTGSMVLYVLNGLLDLFRKYVKAGDK